MRQFNLAIFIATTQLKAKRVQTLIAIISVTFGIAVFIYIVGYIRGVNRFTEEMALAESSDIRLFIEQESTYDNIIDKIYPNQVNFVSHKKPQNKLLSLKDGKLACKELALDNKIKAISYSVKSQVYYHIGSSNISGTITGINFSNEDSFFNLSNKIVSGSVESFNTMPNSFVMGERLRKRLNLSIGDKINITTDKGASVIGVLLATIKTGIPEIDNEICYTNEKTVQNLLGVPSSYITEIKIKLYDNSIAPDLSEKLSRKYGYNSSNWQKDNAALFEGAGLQDFIFNAVALSILFVAGFGIFNILNMIIYEKMKDISILKAMGFSNNDVRIIFISQSLVIGFLGGISGVFLGFLLSWGTSLLPYESDVFVSMDSLPMNFSPIYYLIGLLFGLLTTFLSGYLPSKKAKRLDPVTILRG